VRRFSKETLRHQPNEAGYRLPSTTAWIASSPAQNCFAVSKVLNGIADILPIVF